MAVAVTFLLAIGFAVALLALTLRATARMSRWAEERYVRDFEKTRRALRLIPKVQAVAFYLAFPLVIVAFLAWSWADGHVKSASVFVGLSAVGYLGWFAIRWRHLR